MQHNELYTSKTQLKSHTTDTKGIAKKILKNLHIIIKKYI
jgi:hypothetical protein